ncbi:hypothetical protein [Lysinibacillus sp. BF-4]|uniref:DUF7662 domain-containing protein n=1 Tax=Lysinibacillus sp. BF-4 TaxID=1473546 RepID=UPI0006924510|nr:hypothetical protein [Lysinibacillus sp. BF-4]
MGEKYLPLYQYLINAEATNITLSFEEIEALLCTKLPASAYKHQAWWANQKKHLSQTGAWMNAGYLVEEVSYGQYVRFRREGVPTNISQLVTSPTVKLEALPKLALKMNRVAELFEANIEPFESKTLDEQFEFVHNLSRTLGNISNDLSLLSCYYIEAFLQKNYSLKNCTVLNKAQGAAGLDVDEVTCSGERIIGELKTTYPYGARDFGAAQKQSLKKDFMRLQATEATMKYFFVIEERTFEVLLDKYQHLLRGIAVVLLPAAIYDENAIVVIKE